MSKIIGVGTDIVEVGRVLKSCEKHSFLNKYYTEAERELIKRRKSCAATNFAGKEAVAKAFGTGFLNCMPEDIEILRDEKGKPYVNLSEKAEKIVKGARHERHERRRHGLVPHVFPGHGQSRCAANHLGDVLWAIGGPRSHPMYRISR